MAKPIHAHLDYEALPHASEYLRILSLHAGNAWEPIRCSLRPVSFYEKPHYDALSYTWGDPNATKLIEVDGVAVQVTSNLEQALRHMRDPDNEFPLWVDAVCINQLDTTERSHQVALMGKIYSGCAQVRIWLGCDASQCRLGHGANEDLKGADPFGIIRLLAIGRHVSEWSCFPPDSPHRVVYTPDADFNMMCEGFLAIYRSPWWTRVWTVQEAILPKTGTLYFDTWTASLQMITECGLYYDQHAWKSCCNYAVSQMPLTMAIALKDFCTITRNLYYDRKRDEGGDLKQYDLQTQHVVYGFRTCQDPRDKVYGLLGVVDDRFFTPDYALSKEEVFFQATYKMLRRERGFLKSLTGPQYGPAPYKLASWVRDFDAPYDRMDVDVVFDRYKLFDNGVFNASDDHRSSAVLLKASPRSSGEVVGRVGLGVTGSRVGKVTFVSEDVQTIISLTDQAARRHKDVFKRWMLSALNCSVFETLAYISLQTNLSREPNTVMAFWRTLLGGLDIPVGTESHAWDLKFSPATMRWLEHFLVWVEGEECTIDATLCHMISVITHGRRYFKTGNNGQGLCYPHVRVEDEVWVLDGGNVPFILRPARLNKEEREALKPVDASDVGGDESDGSSGSHQSEKPIEGYYQFIGDCYFDGYMHGEAIRDSTMREQSIVLV
ncbi:hypothetical protein J4E90_008350 [Alternaria incomplexa]|uniref:uncharacterized protein n=1 Tax=Alternaria incomplexa TaxID=1187928 RepID=UPI00222000E7|nr:uncharacterized protein J4E90_008350 [Alternaria incomplexa]KAI4909651.1 hypothetical protein J4E90_008350 [Alternaria incomplexa]